MTDHIQTVVAGAGVVGLAIARKLALSGHDVIVLESADAIGTGTSSRNSEVIHSGIYYPKDSLKARLCVAGRKALYDYCESHGIEYRRAGKLIVATSIEEIETLKSLRAKAENNGVNDLIWLSSEEATALEPALFCTAALLSPSTGIIDSHGYMLALQGDAEASGAMVAFNSPLIGGKVNSGATVERFLIQAGGENPAEFTCTNFVNSAGLGAQSVAHSIEGIPSEAIPPLYYAKGNYFVLSGKAPFQHLIYPAPVSGGLGTHSTLDLGNQTKFGPDVEWIGTPEYVVNPARGEVFYDSIRRYWPALPDGALEAGYSGIRPKLVGPGEEAADFMISGARDHNVAGLVNLFGIESPGLTSSLAIAESVYQCLIEDGNS